MTICCYEEMQFCGHASFAFFAAPFLSTAVTVDFKRCAISNHNVKAKLLSFLENHYNFPPNTLVTASFKALVYRMPRAVTPWQVSPWNASTKHIHDRTKNLIMAYFRRTTLPNIVLLNNRLNIFDKKPQRNGI